MEVLNTAKHNGKIMDVLTDSLEFSHNQEYSKMFKDWGVKLFNLDKTQIWDSWNVTLRFFF